MKLTEADQLWAQAVQNKIKIKMKPVVKRNADSIPYTAEKGVFNHMDKEDIGWWTNGFWGGILWQMYHLTKDELYKTAAEAVEEKLDQVLMCARALDHDNGFKWLPTAVINYKLHGQEASLNRGMLAAGNLAGRYNPAGHFIRAWNDSPNDSPGEDKRGWAIIDCMMNLPLLYWAYEETGDPRFLQIAVNHGDMVLANFIRADGSVNHIVEFDPVTGQKTNTYGGQGRFNGSAWTRGQSWGLYGFIISYRHTNEEKYLAAAQKIADYFIANIPQDGHIPADFYQEPDKDYEDGTASAIAACGLLEIAKAAKGEAGGTYQQAAIRLLRALDQDNCDWSPETDPLLTRCTADYHGQNHNIPIIYGDYYFIEAIGKLNGNDLWIW